MLVAVLIIAVGCVAYTNGANANFKGVASLYGSGTTGLRTAALWGTAATLAGSLAALWLSGGLLEAFGGRGIVPKEQASSPAFLAAVALGGTATSFLATRFGFPVSTTHALVGALVGAGLAGGGEVQLAPLARVLLLPLFFSPAVSAVLGGVVYLSLRFVRLAPDHRTRPLDALHVLSSGAASFARGLNDTPKIAAPLLVVPGLEVHWAFVMVAAGIAVGGLLDARNVAETLGKKVTGMNPGQGFSACVVTAGLVATASLHGLPVSTTHVSVGSLLGTGVVTRQTRWRKAGEILLAWVTTAPCGAALAAAAYLVTRRL
ncbi:MAG: inorganic phosphate transporter family protein [Fimbriiglobus sp.]|jgi:PiT family inorganic phosphate transporter|nr:inorganic phosphate transporter family protein [Fimbriiglobus sp.]